MKGTISIQLFRTMQKGIDSLGKDAHSQIKDFVVSLMTPSDTFKNKNGQEDIYYTLFGLMVAYGLQIPIASRKIEDYLNRQKSNQLDLIHYAAWMRCRMFLPVIKRGRAGLLSMMFRTDTVRPLESFHNLPHQDPFSPYTQFIWFSLQEDGRQQIKNKKEILNSLALYQAEGGGYANRKRAKEATINATAAALSVRGQIEGYRRNEDVDYLINIQDDSGGYKATPVAPIPDLLSTATSLFVLNNYDIQPRISPHDFIEAHWLDSGGFAATLVEDTSDIEYTFYGLLALGACS